jgi:hypothetical protein
MIGGESAAHIRVEHLHLDLSIIDPPSLPLVGVVAAEISDCGRKKKKAIFIEVKVKNRLNEGNDAILDLPGRYSGWRCNSAISVEYDRRIQWTLTTPTNGKTRI